MKAQHAILRFAKYKGPTISRIEAHNERTKEFYASNPDIKTELSKYNFNLVHPKGNYRAEADQMIRDAGCKARKDSVRMVETLITASPEFFAGKKPSEIREFFEHALEFLKTKQAKETIVSAVVHVDEKTPHMHLCFVPITADGRLSAKEIIGNKKKLTSELKPFNASKKMPEIKALLAKMLPTAERLHTYMHRAKATERELEAEIAVLEKEVASGKISVLEQLELHQQLQKMQALEQTILDMQHTMDAIPPEIITAYNDTNKKPHNNLTTDKEDII